MAKSKKTVKAAKKTAAKAKAKAKKATSPKARKPVKKGKAAPKKVAPKAKKTDKKAATKSAIPNLNFFPILTQRPIAHKPSKKFASSNDDKTRYSDEELKEFENLIIGKLDKAKSEYRILKETLNRNNDEGTDATSGGNTKVLEDGAETAEKENLSQLAARQQKYITNLENALVRIKNGTYGICTVTGKLIPKERLIAVPHTTQSIEAKMMQTE